MGLVLSILAFGYILSPVYYKRNYTDYYHYSRPLYCKKSYYFPGQKQHIALFAPKPSYFMFL